MSRGTLDDPLDLTGAIIRPAAEVPVQATEWFDVEALFPNQYVEMQASTTTGSFVHAFAPAQLIVRGSDDWNQIKQRFDLYCLVNFLSPEQMTSLMQTARGFFTDSKEGHLVAAMHSYLPCFSERSVGLNEEDALECEAASYPLPATTAGAFDDLSANDPPPYPDALNLAKSWAESLYTEIRTQEGSWITPHLTVQDGGNVVFEWWNGKKSLSVYVSTDELWFLQSAGPNSEQTEGAADTAETRHRIWQWLTE